MAKIHTRQKRKFRLTTHKNQYSFFHPTESMHRPKTFASEEKAHEWAAKNKLPQGSYTLKAAKGGSKFKVVAREE